jgi:hypothetical protein
LILAVGKIEFCFDQLIMLPRFNEQGLLPKGIHDCTFEEAEARFGRFQETDRRQRLWAGFRKFFDEAKAIDVVIAVLLDGSFVTAKATPNDIDLILALRSSHDFARELSLAEYNVLSAQRVKRLHKLDLLVARENSEQYSRYLNLFQQVRLEPDRSKGIVRLML